MAERLVAFDSATKLPPAAVLAALSDAITESPGLALAIVSAIEGYMDDNPVGGVSDWGDIGGTIADQTDLQDALDGKQVAGSYAAAVHSHTDAAQIPSLPTSKITSGIFDAARIPTLPQSRITGLQAAIKDTPIVVMWVHREWPAYDDDTDRVRLFFSQHSPEAPPPTHHTPYDLWFAHPDQEVV